MYASERRYSESVRGSGNVTNKSDHSINMVWRPSIADGRGPQPR
jgi:hypothetical protein